MTPFLFLPDPDSIVSLTASYSVPIADLAQTQRRLLEPVVNGDCYRQREDTIGCNHVSHESSSSSELAHLVLDVILTAETSSLSIDNLALITEVLQGPNPQPTNTSGKL